MSPIQQRKKQHIQLARESGSQGDNSYWDQYSLPIKTLPEINLDNVDTGVSLFGKTLSQPLIIASMTGGSEHARTINTNLAVAAERCQVAMGVGSQRVALEKKDAKETFQLVRKLAPTTVLFANMGVVQLNYGHTVESYKRVVDMIEADALYLHVNPMQEALQPEGDTNWEGIFSKVEQLVKEIDVPVWVKEVGCGLDVETAKQLVEIGVQGLDVAGVGGTSWTWIEGKRAENDQLTEWFKDFGIRTDEALKALKGLPVTLVGSGGIRNSVHGLKAHMLGADFYSAARPFLDPAMKSSDEVIQMINVWKKGLKLALFGCGMKSWN